MQVDIRREMKRAYVMNKKVTGIYVGLHEMMQLKNNPPPDFQFSYNCTENEEEHRFMGVRVYEVNTQHHLKVCME